VLNNEHKKAINIDTAELVSFVLEGLQPQSVLKDVECTVALSGKILK
jgi:hypothetical protein